MSYGLMVVNGPHTLLKEGVYVISTQISMKKPRTFKCRITALLLNAVKGIEELGAQCIPLGRIHTSMFYRKMIAKEILLAGLEPGMRILHIGSGRLPMTAISLAERGFTVDAMDNDSRSVELSKRVISKLGYEGQVTVLLGDGCHVDCSEYDAVLLSLHIMPKEEVIGQVLQSLKKEGRLVYRNPRGLFNYFYARVYPRDLANQYSYRTTDQSLGKETVVIHNMHSTSSTVSLSSMVVGNSGTILSAAPISQATSMGIRPGKQVTVQAIQHFGGPYIVAIDNRSVAVPRSLAAKIQIGKLGDSHETECITASS